MKFGDLFAEQIKGIAMGLCPAPPISCLVVALTQEATTVQKHRDNGNLFFQQRFIDDGAGVWLVHPDPIINMQRWNEFKREMNSHGLKWIFTEPSKSIVFMDMTISKLDQGSVHTDLYEKPLALYLYIPPRSSHSPGVFKSLIFGQVLRIFTLCSNLPDVQRHIKDFYDRLNRRGYTHWDIMPTLQQAVKHATTFMQLSSAEKLQRKQSNSEQNATKLFLHLPYHPKDPTSSTLQQLFRDHVLSPLGEDPLFELDNGTGAKVAINGMITCYHCHPNLGNIFSVRKLCKKEGSNVASRWLERSNV